MGLLTRSSASLWTVFTVAFMVNHGEANGAQPCGVKKSMPSFFTWTCPGTVPRGSDSGGLGEAQASVPTKLPLGDLGIHQRLSTFGPDCG